MSGSSSTILTILLLADITTTTDLSTTDAHIFYKFYVICTIKITRKIVYTVKFNYERIRIKLQSSKRMAK
jgi:hypothetical protein